LSNGRPPAGCGVPSLLSPCGATFDAFPNEVEHGQHPVTGDVERSS
jgi:hypothetical protein